MDDNIATDGVYTGRYVLVEYGERYEINSSTNERQERSEYTINRQIDEQNYHNVYDSTVWQKIFTTYTDQGGNTFHEKYIMVAELNALAPKMELVEYPSATLKVVQPNEEEITPLYYGDDNQLLHNVGDIAPNSPFFSEIQDTELTYKLYMPKPIELDVNEEVDYHQEKFNIYQSFFDDENDENTDDPTKASGNFIGWKPVIEDENTQPTVNSETGDLEIQQDTLFSKYALNMYLPAFGDILGMLYDTLFGKAATDGGIRPYFYNNGLVDLDQIANIEDKTALNDYSDISKILANNSEGLAGVLNALFADQSVPGETRYYVSADWLAKNTDDKTNVPGIVNKPKVVFNSDKQEDKVYNNHYYIDFSNWELANIFYQKIQIIEAQVIDNFAAKFNSNLEDNNILVTWNRELPDGGDNSAPDPLPSKPWITIEIQLSDFNASIVNISSEHEFPSEQIKVNGNTITVYVDGTISDGDVDYNSDIMFENTFSITTPSPKLNSTFTIKIVRAEQNNGE